MWNSYGVFPQFQNNHCAHILLLQSTYMQFKKIIVMLQQFCYSCSYILFVTWMLQLYYINFQIQHFFLLFEGVQKYLFPHLEERVKKTACKCALTSRNLMSVTVTIYFFRTDYCSRIYRRELHALSFMRALDDKHKHYE